MTVTKAPKVTVLPYMGKPKEEAKRSAQRKNYKPRTVFTDGTSRTQARIKEEWMEI